MTCYERPFLDYTGPLPDSQLRAAAGFVSRKLANDPWMSEALEMLGLDGVELEGS